MQSLILVCLAAHASATLVYYHNGAVAPLDPNVEAAKAAHYKALAEAGGYAGPAFGAAPVGVSAHEWGRKKREADADAYYGHLGYGYGLGYAGYGYGHLGYAGYYGHAAGLPASAAGLVTYANGATVPVEPLANQVARANHFAAKWGRKKREAQFFYGGYGLPIAHPYVPYVAPFVHHPASGAVVPLENAAVVEARHAHLAEVAKQIVNGGVPEVPAAEERKKREAQFFYGGYGLPVAHPYVPYVAPFVHHPASGAVVPLETADVVAARHAHLAEVAKQIVNGGVPEVPAAEE